MFFKQRLKLALVVLTRQGLQESGATWTWSESIAPSTDVTMPRAHCNPPPLCSAAGSTAWQPGPTGAPLQRAGHPRPGRAEERARRAQQRERRHRHHLWLLRLPGSIHRQRAGQQRVAAGAAVPLRRHGCAAPARDGGPGPGGHAAGLQVGAAAGRRAEGGGALERVPGWQSCSMLPTRHASSKQASKLKAGDSLLRLSVRTVVLRTAGFLPLGSGSNAAHLGGARPWLMSQQAAAGRAGRQCAGRSCSRRSPHEAACVRNAACWLSAGRPQRCASAPSQQPVHDSRPRCLPRPAASATMTPCAALSPAPTWLSTAWAPPRRPGTTSLRRWGGGAPPGLPCSAYSAQRLLHRVSGCSPLADNLGWLTQTLCCRGRSCFAACSHRQRWRPAGAH